MGKITDKKRKSTRKLYLTLGALFLLSIGVIIADSKFKLNSDMALSLTNTLVTTVSVVLALWVSCYLLYFELFKDRYPSKLLQERYLPQMINNFAGLVYAFLLGCVILLLEYSDITQIFFCMFSLMMILKVIFNIFGVYKSFMQNTYINSICGQVGKDLENKNSKSLKESLSDIKHILDESIVKEEYFVTQNITKRLGEVFRGFLGNAIRIVDANGDSSEIITCFDRIVRINIYLLSSCKRLNSESLKKRYYSNKLKT